MIQDRIMKIEKHVTHGKKKGRSTQKMLECDSKQGMRVRRNQRKKMKKKKKKKKGR